MRMNQPIINCELLGSKRNSRIQTHSSGQATHEIQEDDNVHQQSQLGNQNIQNHTSNSQGKAAQFQSVPLHFQSVPSVPLPYQTHTFPLTDQYNSVHPSQQYYLHPHHDHQFNSLSIQQHGQYLNSSQGDIQSSIENQTEIHEQQCLSLTPNEQITNPSQANAPPLQTGKDIPSIVQHVGAMNSFKVYVRVRPINAKEKSQQNAKKRLEIIRTIEKSVQILDPDHSKPVEMQKEKTFTFDNVFEEGDDNQRVYTATMGSLLKDRFLEGYNTTAFAYGQTGAGKTYTLFGDECKNEENLGDKESLAKGIVTLAINELFVAFENDKEYKYAVKASYLEIYNESIRDLLVDLEKQQPLMIVEDPSKGIMVPELTEFAITSCNELSNLLQKGNRIRVMASTHSNEFSSRSHCIIQIVVEKTPIDIQSGKKKVISKLSLIDLAGSERAAVSDNKGIRMMEGSKINRSLLALGNCINILSDSRKQGAYVPYRDSKLTRLLKDSLGGNTQTIMIACIAPSFITYEESLNTLKYAQRAKNIKNKIRQNVVEYDIQVSQYKQIIDNLRIEIQSLKRQLNSQTAPSASLEKNDGKCENSNSDQTVKEGTRPNLADDIEDLQERIFQNIEENWEISQTLRDLENLWKKNEESLIKKQEEQRLLSNMMTNKYLKEEVAQTTRQEIATLMSEILMIELNMENNDKVLQDMQSNLEKNVGEKKMLREQIKAIVEDSESGGIEKTLEETCRILQLEKMDLYSQNFQIKKEAQTLALEKEKTVSKLKRMEREMELMKQQLQEKDKIITKSSFIISQLQQKETFLPSNSSKRTPNLVSSFAQISLASKKNREKSLNAITEMRTNRAPLGSLTEERHLLHQVSKETYYRSQQGRQTSHLSYDNSKRKQLHEKQQQQDELSQEHIVQMKHSEKQSLIISTAILNHNIKFDKQSLTQVPLRSPGKYTVEGIQKEYYYFDSNKRLQKRSGQSSIENEADSQRIIPIHNTQISAVDPISKPIQDTGRKISERLSLNLDSLKKFEDIQKQNGERKSQEQKLLNTRKQKTKKKNNQKHEKLDDKLAIEELKNYALKLKQIDFESVKIKPDLKKFKKSHRNELDLNAESKNGVSVTQSGVSGSIQISKRHSQQNLNIEKSEKTNPLDQREKSSSHPEPQIVAIQQQGCFPQMKKISRPSNILEKSTESENDTPRQSRQREEDCIIERMMEIQERIAETQELISTSKPSNFQHSLFEEKQANNFEVFLQQHMTEEKKEDNIPISDDQANPSISEISLMNKVNDNSADQTIQDFICNLEMADDKVPSSRQTKIPTSSFKNEILTPQYPNKKSKQMAKTTNNESVPKFHLKSLDEARVKMRSFKHQLSNLNSKIKQSQISPEQIKNMKQLLAQLDSEHYTLCLQDQIIVKEFKRILSIFKEYDAKKSLSQNFQCQNKNSLSSPSSNHQTSASSSINIPSSFATRPRSINSIGEEGILQNQYYQQQNNFKDPFYHKKSVPNHTHTQNSSHAFQNQSNISVNKKQIEQGAFSKILNNYGEASKVIQSTSQYQNSKKSNKSSTPQAEVSDSSRKFQNLIKQEVKHPQTAVQEQNNEGIPQNQSEIGQTCINTPSAVHLSQLTSLQSLNAFASKNSSQISETQSQHMNKINLGNSQPTFSMTNANQSMQMNNNQSQLSTNRGKSVTSYVSINSKKKIFKEDSDKIVKNDNIKQLKNQDSEIQNECNPE